MASTKRFGSTLLVDIVFRAPWGKELGNGDAEGGRERLECAQSDIALSAFDGAHVGAVQATDRGEVFLREVLCATPVPDVIGQHSRQHLPRFS